jgi:hypothetical protein
MGTRLLPVLFLLAPVAAVAGSLEVEGRMGSALSSYDQSFPFTPGLGIPGLTFREASVFRMEGRGGLAAGGGATWYVAGPLGIEARIDSAAIGADLSGARYVAQAWLPPPLGPVTATLDLGTGTAEVDRVTSISLNLRLRAPGHVRVWVSGGVSYLPDFGLTAAQRVSLSVSGLGLGGTVEVASLNLRAESAPIREGGGRLGGNAGAGLAVAVAPRVSLVAEGRAFLFRKRRAKWVPVAAPRSEVEEALERELRERLPAVEFNPTFFQATLGVSVRL